MATKEMAGLPVSSGKGGRGKGRGRKPTGTEEKRDKSKGESSPYLLRKHPAKKPSQRKNDVYVNRTADFATQMARCRKLFEEGHSEVFIHGLGVAINRAINLALQLKETSAFAIEVEVSTSTVEVTDDLEPTQDDFHQKTQSRLTSAVHIHLKRDTLQVSSSKIVYSSQSQQVHKPSQSQSHSTAGGPHTAPQQLKSSPSNKPVTATTAHAQYTKPTR